MQVGAGAAFGLQRKLGNSCHLPIGAQMIPERAFSYSVLFMTTVAKNGLKGMGQCVMKIVSLMWSLAALEHPGQLSGCTVVLVHLIPTLLAHALIPVTAFG